MQFSKACFWKFDFFFDFFFSKWQRLDIRIVIWQRLNNVFESLFCKAHQDSNKSSKGCKLCPPIFKLRQFLSKSGLCNLNWPISRVSVLNQSPISANPIIVRNLIDQKTVITGDPLYYSNKVEKCKQTRI